MHVRVARAQVARSKLPDTASDGTECAVANRAIHPPKSFAKMPFTSHEFLQPPNTAIRKVLEESSEIPTQRYMGHERETHCMRESKLLLLRPFWIHFRRTDMIQGVVIRRPPRREGIKENHGKAGQSFPRKDLRAHVCEHILSDAVLEIIRLLCVAHGNEENAT